MPGIFESSIQRVREKSDSLRVTIPEGVATVLGAVPDGRLLWSVDLRAGTVTVTAEPPSKKSSKRD